MALTIFSVVMGVLFVRERKKAQSLQTDLQLKDTADKVKVAKEKVKVAEEEYEEANENSLSSYAEYKRAHKQLDDES